MRLLEEQFFSNVAEIDFKSIAEKLESKTNNRNEYSQAKNAFLNFAEFSNVQVTTPNLKESKKRRYRKLKFRKLEDINHKINVISDKKLLLCYKTMLSTGLRVGELANIKGQDIQLLENGCFLLEFVSKGGNINTVTIPAKQKYLCKELKSIKQLENGTDKIFYSVGHLQKHAKQRGFACHDLRRAFAKMTYKDNKRNIMQTSKEMRHSSPRTTKIYLKSKVEV